MSNKKENSNKATKGRKKKGGFLKGFFLSLTVLALMAAGIAGGLVYASIKDLPSFNPKEILEELNLNSYIYDESGTLIEKIRAEENRTIVPLENIPKDLQNAIVAIEDERFWDHHGIDLRSITGSLLENIKAGSVVRGASTITQQLAKNVYLSNEVHITRKIKEAYIALQLENSLSKEEILEAYLNSVYFGQGAYGVHEASETYFSKDISELTLAESAVIAGVTNSPSNLSPYILVRPENLTSENRILGDVTILGEVYTAVFNEKSLDRQRLILSEMREQGYISAADYDSAISEDISAAVIPGKQDEEAMISSYFVDYVKNQVVEDLVNRAGYTEESAHRELYTGGVKVYSTVDIELQRGVEEIYQNFGSYVSSGKLSSWSSDPSGNIVSESGNIVYYRKNNILDENGNLLFSPDEFKVSSNGDIVIDSPKLIVSSDSIDIRDYYALGPDGNLLTHSLGKLSLSKDNYSVEDDGAVRISSGFLNEAVNFNMSSGSSHLVVGNSYFSNDEVGVLQPQAATVVLEQSSGKIAAIVGGRNMSGQKILNRALLPRQVGSVMKPLGAYLPALDNGYTAATPVDDIPYLNEKGDIWPNNYDSRYRGLISLRESVELSVNTNAVKTVEDIGVKTSMKYLERMGIIKSGAKDSFVTRQEDREHNDENLAALGLGGLSKGISPLDIAGAYASIANEGTYIKPRSYVKVEDRNGNVILDNTPSKTKVVSPETAFIMTDVLRTTVSDGLSIAKKARIDSGNSGIPVAGKTGTTNDNADVWFAGYTPYYTGSVWIGNDSQSVVLSQDSGMAAQLFSSVMKLAHKNLPDRGFERPSNIVEREICTVSGKLVGEVCDRDHRHVIRKELFVRGTEPISKCDAHVLLKVDLSTGKLAKSGCPSLLVMNRFFIKRSVPYDPEKYNGLYPEDYMYAPPEVCHHRGSALESDTEDEPRVPDRPREDRVDTDTSVPETVAPAPLPDEEYVPNTEGEPPAEDFPLEDESLEEPLNPDQPDSDFIRYRRN